MEMINYIYATVAQVVELTLNPALVPMEWVRETIVEFFSVL